MSSSQYSLTSTIKIYNNISIPLIHLGVYMTSGRETSNAVTYALESGYRAIDSAEWYANESEVGSAIKKFLSSPNNQAGLKREDIWFTTKLKTNTSYNATRKSIKASIKRSGLRYLDLYLLHSPYGGKQKRLECWRAVEDAIDEGEVRCGGVSNFGVRHLQELLDSNPRIVPAINQIEVHPFNTQTSITAFCASQGIQIQAYAPLARAERMHHPTILELAEKNKCTPAQIFVRWSLQKRFVTLPKSTKRERIVENADVGGVVLGKSDMRVLDGLDEGLVTDWDPTDAD